MERGAYLRTRQWAKYKAVDQKIHHALHNDAALLDQMQTPSDVFITWETEEGVNRAVDYNAGLSKTPQFQTFLSEPIKVE